MTVLRCGLAAATGGLHRRLGADGSTSRGTTTRAARPREWWQYATGERIQLYRFRADSLATGDVSLLTSRPHPGRVPNAP